MVWITFILTAAVIVFAANQLAKYGDVIALRTRMGRMFIGVLLLAGATSLPEVLTSISSLNQSTPNLAAGNLLGSNSFNMVLLAIIDILNRDQRILRKAAMKHALTGSLAVFMIALVVLLIMADIKISLGWVGLDSLILISTYILAVWLIQQNSSSLDKSIEFDEISKNIPGIFTGVVGFLLASIELFIATPIMVRSANQIAEVTGLGTSFIGTTLVALVTSLPELVTTMAAIKIGANDMAIGNLFGSNMFNMFAIGLTDIFYTQGRFLAVIDPSFLLIGMFGLIMTAMALIGNIAKLEKRILFIEIDAFALIMLYIASIWLLYSRT
jgi:cation:H+ antiporter